MDPLSAFSLASGVAQLISFTGELVAAGNAIYHAADGRLVENRELEDVTKDLQDLTHEVTRAQAKLLSGQHLEPDEWRLRVICDNCTSIAQELTQNLEKLKVQGKHRRLKSYRLALMSVWQKDEVEKIAERLEKYRRELDSRILVGLRKRLEHIDLASNDRFDALDRRTQDIVLAITGQGGAVDAHLTDQDQMLAKLLSGQHDLLKIVADQARSPSPAPPYEASLPQRTSTPLHEAVLSGDLTRVRQIFRTDNVDVNAKDGHGCTALHLADTPEIAKKILSDRRTDPHSEDNGGRTALHYAVLRQLPEVMKVLLDAGIDAGLEDDDRRSALFYASECPAAMWLLKYGTATEARAADHLDNTGLLQMAWLGDLEGTKFFLGQGANVNARNQRRETALTEASRHGDVDVVVLLLSHDVDLELAAADEWTPLLQAVRNNRFDVVPLLLKHGTNVDARLKNGNNPLAEACARGHFDVAELLIEAGCDIHGTDSEHLTPLLRAAYRGSVKFTRFLLSRGPNLEAKDKWGCTPVHKAPEGGHKKTLKVLLGHGASTYTKSNDGFTPLSIAANKGHIECVERLLDAGADLNTQGHLDHTALAEASHHGRVEIVQLLISRGADFEIRQHQGFTPLCVAAHMGRNDVVEMLVEVGADREATGHAHLNADWKNTPLQRAAWFNHPSTIALLVGLGCDIEARDYFGRTPLRNAARHKHVECVSMLIQKGADVDTQANDGITPLMSAAILGPADICRLLLDAGARGSLRDRRGCTAWILAKQHANDRKLESLLKPSQETEKSRAVLREKHPIELAARFNKMYL